MEDLITGAETFSNYLRFQFFKKQRQAFEKANYLHKVWGSQIKGGLEVCDDLLLKEKNNKFANSDEVISRYVTLIDLIKKEIPTIDTEKTFEDYALDIAFKIYGNEKKLKVSALGFKEDIRFAVLRGSLIACKKLLEDHLKDPIHKTDILMGEVHILRMKYWNTYQAGNRQKVLRKVDVVDTMQVNPKNLILS